MTLRDACCCPFKYIVTCRLSLTMATWYHFPAPTPRWSARYDRSLGCQSIGSSSTDATGTYGIAFERTRKFCASTPPESRIIQNSIEKLAPKFKAGEAGTSAATETV